MADKKFPTDFVDVITTPSANDKFMITDSTAGEALKRILWSSFPFANAGFIQTELVPSGTNLLVVKPKMVLEPTIGTRYIVDNTADTTIALTAVGGMSASTWYALCCREDTGAITAEDIATKFPAPGGNWDIVGNALNMYDQIWDADRKYCRAYDGTNYYRIFGVFKTNTTPDGIEILNGNIKLFPINNIPLSAFYVFRQANLSTAGEYIIQYDTIAYDINSEYNTTTHRYLPKTNWKMTFSAAIKNAATVLSVNFIRKLGIVANSGSIDDGLIFSKWANPTSDVILGLSCSIPSYVNTSSYYNVVLDIESKTLVGASNVYFQGISVN